MRACLEFHASGGVRFGVDFAPYMVTKRFASDARQIRVCVVFPPNRRRADQSRGGPWQEGGATTRRRPNESRPRTRGPRPGRGEGATNDCVQSAKSASVWSVQLLLECASSLLECASSLIECVSLSGSAADCIARIQASRLVHCCRRSTISTREIISCHLPASRRSVPTPDATLRTWCLERPRVAGSSPVTPRSSRTTRGGQVQASFSSLSPSSLRADEVHLFLGICVCVCVSLGPVSK